jgi:hypothetical protein
MDYYTEPLDCTQASDHTRVLNRDSTVVVIDVWCYCNIADEWQVRPHTLLLVLLIVLAASVQAGVASIFESL